MTPNIAIIGAGPAGLLAAHGALLAECEVTIYAADVRSRFPGAQVLQMSIPGLTQPYADALIHGPAKWGQEENYRAKIYGPDSDVRTSWEQYVLPVRAWDMTNVYGELLRMMQARIIEQTVTPCELREIGDDYDAIINTAPAPFFCLDPAHSFPGANVKITPSAQAGVHHNQVVYNGTNRDQWYRSSRLFGHGSTEWPEYALSGGILVRKPVSTDCDCWLDLPHYYRAGRFGKWEKGILVHDGYEMGVKVAHALHASAGSNG